jgi:hypothetical protein
MGLKWRFWSKVAVGLPDECWPWQASIGVHGYGQFSKDGKPQNASRVAWELHYGRPFPKGLDACHSCNNRPCCNPAHIYAGTRKDNVADAIRAGTFRYPVGPYKGATHCKRGHEFTPENTYVWPRNGQRFCLTCKAIRRRLGGY